MKTSCKFLHATRRHLLVKAVLTGLVLVTLSLIALPIVAADAEADAKKAFDAWRAAAADVDAAKTDLKKAQEKLGTLMTAAALSGKKITAAQQAQLADARAKVANAEAALKAAEEKLEAARAALEKAIAELPDDSAVKKELKRLRDALTSQATKVISRLETNSGGLQVATFDLAQGRVIVNLPDDIRAGDTISGTVMTEPNGNTPEEKEKNKTLLESYMLELGETMLPVSQPSFRWLPPAPLNPAAPVRYQLKIVEVLPGQTPVARSE